MDRTRSCGPISGTWSYGLDWARDDVRAQSRATMRGAKLMLSLAPQPKSADTQPGSSLIGAGLGVLQLRDQRQTLMICDQFEIVFRGVV